MIFSVFTRFCKHHHYLIPEHFITLKRKPILLVVTPHPHSQPLPPLTRIIYFLALWICLFCTFHLKGIIYMLSSVSDLSFSMFSEFIMYSMF